MEYCRRGSLSTLLKKGTRPNEHELREIATCCLFALYYLHNRNIIHGVRKWREPDGIGHQSKQSAPF